MSKRNYNFAKLRGKIREVYSTEYAFAMALSRSQNYLTNVFSGKSYFTMNDISNSCDLLGIPDNEMHDYFFVEKVHETEQE